MNIEPALTKNACMTKKYASPGGINSTSSPVKTSIKFIAKTILSFENETQVQSRSAFVKINRFFSLPPTQTIIFSQTAKRRRRDWKNALGWRRSAQEEDDKTEYWHRLISSRENTKGPSMLSRGKIKLEEDIFKGLAVKKSSQLL